MNRSPNNHPSLWSQSLDLFMYQHENWAEKSPIEKATAKFVSRLEIYYELVRQQEEGPGEGPTATLF